MFGDVEWNEFEGEFEDECKGSGDGEVGSIEGCKGGFEGGFEEFEGFSIDLISLYSSSHLVASFVTAFGLPTNSSGTT